MMHYFHVAFVVVALFNFVLFEYFTIKRYAILLLHYTNFALIHIALFLLHCFNFALFDAALFTVELLNVVLF